MTRPNNQLLNLTRLNNPSQVNKLQRIDDKTLTYHFIALQISLHAYLCDHSLVEKETYNYRRYCIELLRTLTLPAYSLRSSVL